jgi:hypothetical protein
VNTADLRRDAGELEAIAAEAWGRHGRLLAKLDRNRETAKKAEAMSLRLSQLATAHERLDAAWEAGMDVEDDPEAFERLWKELTGA